MPDSAFLDSSDHNQSLFQLCRELDAIEDPRQQGKVKHLLGEVIVCALCALICGGRGAEAMEEFTRTQLGWLRGFLSLKNGVPSHDTFRNVFSMLDPDALSSVIAQWVGSLSGKHISIDGKVNRGTGEGDERSLCVLRAWVDELSLSAGQVACSKKSNEIEAIPRLLKKLKLKDATVTIDAVGCQREIAAIIDKADGAYVLALKGNQKSTHEVVLNHFDSGGGAVAWRTEEFSHGRYEKRTCVVENNLSFFGKSWKWDGITCVAKVTSEVCRPEGRGADGSEATTEDRYYLCSTEPNASLILDLTRSHWGIENRCHWMLDVAFKEDASPVRDHRCAQNYSILREIAASILRQDSSKGSVPRKMLRAALDPDFRLKLLSNFHA